MTQDLGYVRNLWVLTLDEGHPGDFTLQNAFLLPLPQLRGSLGDVAQVTNAAYLCITAVLDKNPGPWILSVRVLLNFTKLISSGRCVFFLCLIFFIIYTTTDGKPMHFWASGDLPMTKAYWLSTTYGKNSVLVSGFLQ